MYNQSKIEDQLFTEVPNQPKLNWYIAKAIKHHGTYDLVKGNGYMIAKIISRNETCYIVVDNDFDIYMQQTPTRIIPERIAKAYLRTKRDQGNHLVQVLEDFQDILNHNYSNFDDRVRDFKVNFYKETREKLENNIF